MKMNDDQLKDLFNQAESKPDEQAKSKALQAAMAEFRAAHKQGDQSISQQQVKKQTFFQGIIKRLRPMVETPTNKRTNAMKMNYPKWQYGGIATASVLAVAVMIAYQNPDQDFNQASQFRVDKDQTVTLSQEPKMEELIVRAEKREQSVQEKELMVDKPAVAQAPMRQMAEADLAMGMAKSKKMQAFGGVAQQSNSSVMSYDAVDVIAPPSYNEPGRDRFESVDDNPIKRVSDEPVSTFSVDVDTASYSFVRRQLNQGVLPQKDAVRIEEMVNYFDYAYPVPESKQQPFTTNVEVMDSPWKAGNKLVHIGIKGYEIAASDIPKSNLVFLLDVSGSMNSSDKLPLVKQSMELLLSQLKPDDTVAIAVYAGAAGTVLEPTAVKDKSKILAALNRLQAGGSTAGGQGLKLAYGLAEQHFDKAAVNRIILATDGDFNVGIQNRDELKGFVERKRDQGIYLSVLGFGQGNYHDQLMQTLAQNGNGVAAYIDTLSEAQKVLVDQATSSLFTIAKDVKIQMEFNPSTVSEYRLLGYETRHLETEDFNNDKVDAGDIGAGHTVTAIYEITPVGVAGLLPESRYAKPEVKPEGNSNEYGFLKLRYKLPEDSVSQLISQPIVTAENKVSQEAEFATAVAGFSQLLKGGQYTGSWSYDDALSLAQKNKGDDLYGYRTEFVQLIRKAKTASEM